MPGRARFSAVVIVSALLLACGGESSTEPTVTIASVSVTSTVAVVEVSKTLLLTAVAKDAELNTVAGAAVEWSSSNNAVATVSPGGVVTGVATGDVTITATAGGKTGTKALTVFPSVASFAIVGATAAEVGSTTQLTATPKDAAGNAIPGLTVSWTSSAPTIIGVGNDGTVTATRIGNATINASAGAAQVSIEFTSNLAPYTFSFPGGTSAADMQTIRDGVQYAHAYHKTIFDRQIKEATTVAALLTATGGCGQGGAAAFTGLHSVTFCLGNPGWIQNGPIMRQKIVQHETFHIWQFEYKWLGNPATAGATWVIEGSAELMGFKGVDAKNQLSYSTALGCQIKQVADFAVQQPPGLPALSSVESQQSFQTTVGPLYAQSMLAMDQLTTSGGLITLKTYADAIAGGTQWQTAFQNSFGMTTSNFYSQFPAYRAGQAVPPNYLCGGV